jgi:sterol desaturase/sphingolipid hydroxylase (fatty acid hydroxylase superfamily)
VTRAPATPIHWPHLGLLALLVAAWPLAASSTVSPTAALAAWLALNVAVLALAERWRPHRRDWAPTPRHLARDGTVWSLNLLVDALASAALAAVAIAWAPGTSSWPIALQVGAGLLVAEFGSYLLHRWSHRDGWLWRVHLLHHRPDRLNLANAITAHPLNAAYDKLARTLPLLALGLAPDAVLAVALFGLTQALVAHANVAGTIGVLEWVIGSARAHRLHHSTREAEAGNFGTTLPFWDQVFGTWRRGAEPAAVGVFSPASYPGEFELAALLAWPLRRAWNRRPLRLRCC